MNVTVNFTYYDAPTKMEEIINRYAGNLPEDVTVCVVDDGSPRYPIDRLPTGWKLYRVTEDIGWNSEGAKNLAMHVSETEWNVTCDLDHPVVTDHLSRLGPLTDVLPPLAGYNPVRLWGSKCVNCYLTTKEAWWDPEVNGYDETFTGLYGYDFTLTRKMRKRFGVHRLEHINLDTIGGETPVSRDAKANSREGIFKLLGQIELGKAQYTDERMRFPWQRLQ